MCGVKKELPLATGLKVAKRWGERAIRIVTRLRLMDREYAILGVENALVIPLTRTPAPDEGKALTAALDAFEVVHASFPTRARRARSLVEALNNILPPDLVAYIPRAMDIVGSLAIVDIAPELEAWKSQVGHAILQVNRHVETVLARAGHVQGAHRVRPLEVIAGTGETQVTHREHGCTYQVDPTQVYFTPRLSEERRRVAEQVREGETIVDMFASVGPFAIQIAKTRAHVTVYAVDVNERAYALLQRNVRANGVESRVIPILGDIRTVGEQLEGGSDRVIVDLPEQASAFIDVACRLLKLRGGILHYYCFQSEPAALETAAERLREAVANAKRGLQAVVYKRRLRPIAPRRWQIVLDAAIR
jgi:tRNA (guanine37-N1)-methyltransferase